MSVRIFRRVGASGTHFANSFSSNPSSIRWNGAIVASGSPPPKSEFVCGQSVPQTMRSGFAATSACASGATSANAGASFQVHAIGTGVRHELTSTLAVDAGLGYSFTTSDAPQKDGHNGVIGNVKLTKTFNSGQASLGYARRLTAGGSTGDVVIEDTVSTTASINLTGKLTAELASNVSWFNFLGVTTSTATFDNSDRRFLSIRPSLTYQILRPWSVSVAYTYEYTDYTDSTIANLSNHRLFLSTQYALREWLVLGLSYRYGAQREHGNVSQAGVSDFTDNQVMLTVTASPALRF